MTDTVVTTEYGQAEGIVRDDCRCWFGLPFAKAPVGDLAFRHPEKPDPWHGVDIRRLVLHRWHRT